MVKKRAKKKVSSKLFIGIYPHYNEWYAQVKKTKEELFRALNGQQIHAVIEIDRPKLILPPVIKLSTKERK